MKKKIFCAIIAIFLLLNISVVFATETNEVEEDLILTMNDSVEDLTDVHLVSDISNGQRNSLMKTSLYQKKMLILKMQLLMVI